MEKQQKQTTTTATAFLTYRDIIQYVEQWYTLQCPLYFQPGFGVSASLLKTMHPLNLQGIVKSREKGNT